MTTTTFSLAGIVSQEDEMLHYEHPRSGTKLIFSTSGHLINKTLSFIKVIDQLADIAEVNKKMGFFVADEVMAIVMSPKDVIRIMTNCVYREFMLVDNYYKFVKKELTRLSSRRGRKAIRRETHGAAVKHGMGPVKLELTESPVLQFITSFMATIWHHTLNDTLPEVELAFGGEVLVNPHSIYSLITTKPNPHNPDYTTISILTGNEGEPLPDKLFTQGAAGAFKLVPPTKQNKKKRRRRK